MGGQRGRMLLVTAVTLGLAYGVWYAYSVVLVALLKEFGWSRSVLAGAFSVFTIVHGVANPVLGAICDRIGPRRVIVTGGCALSAALVLDASIGTPGQLYLLFGVLTAIAVSSCGWIPSVVLIQRHFSDRLGLALGLISAGVGLGMLFVVPLCQFLIDAIGWRGAFRALGTICLACIVPANLFWVSDRRVSGSATVVQAPSIEPAVPAPFGADLTLREATRMLPFWLLVGASFFGNVNSQTMHVHQVAFLVDHGMAALVASTVVGVVGVASIFGKIGGGWLSDRVEREKVFVAGVSIMIASVAVIGSMVLLASPWIAYVYAVMLGVGYSATASLLPAMMNDRFGGQHFGVIFGVCMLGSSLGSAVGPWLAGSLFDATGSYRIPFTIAAACGMISAAMVWYARVLRVRASMR